MLLPLAGAAVGLVDDGEDEAQHHETLGEDHRLRGYCHYASLLPIGGRLKAKHTMCDHLIKTTFQFQMEKIPDGEIIFNRFEKALKKIKSLNYRNFH